jgi:hypothetical protein
VKEKKTRQTSKNISRPIAPAFAAACDASRAEHSIKVLSLNGL